MLESKQVLAYDDPSKTFVGVRFILLGFDSVKEEKIRSKLVEGGGLDAVNYGPDCNHVIVDKLVYDDPICVAARRDGKMLVTGLWVDHSFDVGMPVDHTSVMYRPLRDLNGIPGADSQVVCLTGYQRQDRDDIMTMVGLMGANFSKPLVANKVTHLICYKFEGEKYELAKKMKRIKLVNHRWLEDCLKAWELLPEADYTKSGYELEMEAEAKDSEEETEDVALAVDLGRNIVASPQNTGVENKNFHQLPVKQDVLRNNLYLSPSKSMANSTDTSKIQSTPGMEINFQKTSFSRESRDKHLDMLSARSPDKISSEVPSDMHHSKVISEKVDNVLSTAYESSKKSPGADVSKLSSMSYFKSTPRKPSLPPMSERTESNLGGSPSPSNANQIRVSGGFNVPLERHQDGTGFDGVKTPLKGTLLHLDERQTVTSSYKRKMTGSHGSSKSLKLNHNPKTTEVLASGSSVDGSHVLTGGISPTTVTRCSKEEASIGHTEALNISVTSEDRQEFDDQAVQTSPQGLQNRTPLNVDLKDLSSSRTNNCSDGAVMHQNDQPSIAPPFPRTNHGVENNDGQANLNFPEVGRADTNQKPLKRKMLAKKTLGSRPSFFNTSTKKHKGSINLQKAVLQNEWIVHSDEAVAMEDIDNATEKVVMVPPTSDEDGPVDGENKAPNDEEQNELDLGSNKEKSAEFETPPSGKGVINSKKQAGRKIKQVTKSVGVKNSTAEKAVLSENTKLAESKYTVDAKEKTITKGNKSPLVRSKVKNKKDRAQEVTNDGSNSKQDEEKAVCSEKTELMESKHTDDGGGKKTTKGTKRPLVKSKAKNKKDSREELTKDGSNSKQDEKKTSGNEEIVVLLGRTKGRPSKKSKGSTDVEKENKPATIKQQSVSNDNAAARKVNSQSRKRPPKNVTKADPTNTNSVKAVQNLELKTQLAWFILSGHKLQRKEFQQVIRRLKGRVCRDSHHWSYQATHFIVPDPIRRTEKFFAAAASGSWILKTDYLTASNEAGRFLSEEPYEWHKKCLTEDGAINLEAPRKWRLLRERTGHGAFYGMRIVIYGECIAPPLDTLKRVVKAGDGTILATSPPYTRFLQSGVDFAIVSPGMPRVDMWVQEFLRHEVPCVLADYLVEYVCKPGYSLERHVQYNTHSWAEKSLENLVNRVEEEVVEDMTTPKDQLVDDVACQVCGRHDRGDEMLICGDETGSRGCGVGIHFDCLDPPLNDVPEEDWFCPSCSQQKKESKSVSRSSKKQKSKSKK